MTTSRSVKTIIYPIISATGLSRLNGVLVTAEQLTLAEDIIYLCLYLSAFDMKPSTSPYTEPNTIMQPGETCVLLPTISDKSEQFSSEDLGDRESDDRRWYRGRRGPVTNDWKYEVDNDFPRQLSNFRNQWGILRRQSATMQFCKDRKCIHFLHRFVNTSNGHGFECKSSELREMANDCELCGLIYRGFQRYEVWFKEKMGDRMSEKFSKEVGIFKKSSMLIMGLSGVPVLTIYPELG